MPNPNDEEARRAFYARQQEQLRPPPQPSPWDQQQQRKVDRQQYWNLYFRIQAFKLVYILCIIFVLPVGAMLFAALYMAIYEPEYFRRAAAAHRVPPEAPVKALENPSFFVRQAALQKLLKEQPGRNDRELAAKIKNLLHDPNPQIRELAIDALGDCGQPEDAPALVEWAKDQFSHFERPRICQALGKLKGEQSLSAMIEMLLIDPAVRDLAIKLLASFGPEAENALLKRGETAVGDERAVICTALGDLGTDQSVPFLEKATEDEKPAIAEAAKQALRKVQERK